MAIEESALSHQLAVLRGTGLVIARHVGTAVEYSLSSDEVAGVLRAAHEVLANSALGQERPPAVSRVEHTW
ncbi:helix-turn-helix domain-containing protein [Umezawaea sp. Da 62-37]|uniref:ArsR/SmtB family transcription factor n=1 Tax=Umezawaea sp. Da 62-37 TaxID=3075927 RepID=UPI0028F74289|nr:helix-turn-helix domain-containing protein [Umezawaea sp. Da 62-37]WNV84856.1 helix-turn-helix domain-containing protein [Umezawaea sp. Da 62-37]